MQQWAKNAYAEARNTKRKYEKEQKNLEFNTVFSDLSIWANNVYLSFLSSTRYLWRSSALFCVTFMIDSEASPLTKINTQLLASWKAWFSSKKIMSFQETRNGEYTLNPQFSSGVGNETYQISECAFFSVVNKHCFDRWLNWPSDELEGKSRKVFSQPNFKILFIKWLTEEDYRMRINFFQVLRNPEDEEQEILIG